MSSVAAPPEQEGKLPPSRADTQAEIRSAGTIKAFNFFVYGAIAVYSTYFPLYLQGIGMSKIQIGALLAGGPFISLLANPFWGYWSDRLRNIKRMLLLMLIGNLLVMQAVFQLGSIPFIYGAMLVFFFFQMPLFSQTNSLILNSIEGTRHKFGAFRLWGSLGWALLAVGSGPAVAALGVNRLWVVYTLLMLVSIGFALALPKGESKKKEGFSNSGYGKVFTNRAFLMLVLLGVLISVPNSMNMTFVAIFISEMGGKEALIGWSAFLSSIFEIPIFLLLDRYLKRNVSTMVAGLIIISGLFTLRWLLMSAVADPYMVVWIQGLHCLTFGGYYYIGTQLTSMLVPAEFRSSGQAAYALTWGGLSGIVAGIAGGWLFQEMGPQVMYLVGAGMSVLGIIGFIVMYRLVKRKN
ncbi:MFS transporter [Paenibacillus pinihumi]|uniref:MFS transporter n=1 Tax=Paenibacillus pinihumi TaxID=669462 RepID=UPI00040EDC1A|nr:MFS transporter [Paenibacillus pinihumi]